MNYIVLPIVGLLVGLFVVSLGGGGGAIYVGILMTWFHVPAEVAASTSLATMIPTMIVGSYSHWKAGNINLKPGKYMILGGLAGVFFGSFLSHIIPSFWYNKIAGIIFVFIDVQMIISILKKQKKKHANHLENSTASFSVWKISIALIYGILGGIMCGLLGLSGGGPIVSGLFVLGSNMLESAGTSILVLTVLSSAGFIMHLGLGNISWGLVSLLLIGTIAGALIGPMLLKRIHKNILELVLQPTLVLLIGIMGISLFFK